MPIVLNGSGPITGVTSLNTTVSDTELGYLDGVTSALQTQINTAGGLVKITDSSFTSAASVSVNNCFTSTYTNYRIIYQILGTTQGGTTIRMRVSGSDNTATNYNYQSLQVYSTTVVAGRVTGGTNWPLDASIVNERNIMIIDLFNPQSTAPTTGIVHQGYRIDSSTPQQNYWFVGHTASTSFDGITVACGGGTGSIRVYGYRD